MRTCENQQARRERVKKFFKLSYFLLVGITLFNVVTIIVRPYFPYSFGGEICRPFTEQYSDPLRRLNPPRGWELEQMFAVVPKDGNGLLPNHIEALVLYRYDAKAPDKVGPFVGFLYNYDKGAKERFLVKAREDADFMKNPDENFEISAFPRNVKVPRYDFDLAWPMWGVPLSDGARPMHLIGVFKLAFDRVDYNAKLVLSDRQHTFNIREPVRTPLLGYLFVAALPTNDYSRFVATYHYCLPWPGHWPK